MAYPVEPLAGGWLSGRYSKDRRFARLDPARADEPVAL